MNLKERIQKDFMEAFKAKEAEKTLVFKMLQAAIKNAEIEKKGELGEEETVQIVSKEAKKRKDAIEAYEKGGRGEQAEKEKKELEILSAYLPEQMPEEEIRNLVREAVEKSGAADIKEIGKVMAILMPQVKGKADGALVNKIVRETLG